MTDEHPILKFPTPDHAPPEEEPSVQEQLQQVAEEAAADPDALRLCNCAECGTQLVSINDLAKAKLLPDKDKLRLGLMDPKAPAGRIQGRPYCSRCLARGYK